VVFQFLSDQESSFQEGTSVAPLFFVSVTRFPQLFLNIPSLGGFWEVRWILLHFSPLFWRHQPGYIKSGHEPCLRPYLHFTGHTTYGPQNVPFPFRNFCLWLWFISRFSVFEQNGYTPTPLTAVEPTGAFTPASDRMSFSKSPTQRPPDPRPTPSAIRTDRREAYFFSNC